MSVIGTLAVTALVVSACASMIDGRTQQVLVTTDPPGADCGLYREGGLRIATIQNTPGSATITKTKHDISIVCVKTGYQQATYLNHSGLAGSTAVNLVGGIFTLGISTAIGAAVDASTGAGNEYQSQVDIRMTANSPDQSEAQATLPATYGPVGKSAETKQAASQTGANAPSSAPATASPTPPSASTPEASGTSVTPVSGSAPLKASTER
ncbi:hypothetical protein [Enhydrobacter aerosaccus]|uniref:hypothetical protein n=1 Tax=Enhydrobacter aerosaccus TaxID=225324 RepID=UPI000A2F3B4C|nr:hypothetical protein [Enhydrobacter aerosaccus]